MKDWAAWLPVLLLIAAAPVRAQPAERLDLLAVHERAQQNAPLLLRAEAARGEQAAGVRAAGAQLGPKLSALAEAGGPRAGTRQATLQLSQPLFDAPAWQQRAAARQRLQSRDAELAAGQQQLRQASGRLYLQWHAQAQSVRVQTQLAQAYAEEARRMGVRHREGLAAAVDWRQSQSFQWLAEASARGSEQLLRGARQQLVAQTGDAGLATAELRPLRPGALPPPTPQGGAQHEAPADPPRRAAAVWEAAAREQELAAAQQGHWPQLSVQASAQRDGLSRQNTNEWSLQLRVPLWDSGSRAAASDAARQRLLSAQADLLQLDRELQSARATQHERLAAAREQHATAQGALAAAEQTVAAMRVGQEQGSRSTSDVLLALQTLSQLRSLAAQAQAEAWLAWIDLLAAEGRLDDAALRLLNDQLE